MDSLTSLKNALQAGTSPFHTAQYASDILLRAGFAPLPADRPWTLEKGGRYFTVGFHSLFMAFAVGTDFSPEDDPRLAAAHLDWPCLRVKPDPELPSGGCCRLAVEPYGGMIYSSWLDRPLSAAGIVTLRGDTPARPETRLVDFGDPVLVIPNLAIHMNRSVNEGVALNPAKDMLPLCHIAEESWNRDGYFLKVLAQKLSRAPEDILSYDLCVYVAEEPRLQGFDGDFLTSPRLDNLTSVSACLNAVAQAKPVKGISGIFLYDNEETGSQSKQGADSLTASFWLEKLTCALGLTRAQHLDFLQRGLLLSCDVAHAAHPNHMDMADPACQAHLGGGVTLKLNFRQKYPTDAQGLGIVKGICAQNAIPFQTFMNRADLAGGGTIGAYASSLFSMRTVDVGVPILGMHSARETMAARDQEALDRLAKAWLA